MAAPSTLEEETLPHSVGPSFPVHAVPLSARQVIVIHTNPKRKRGLVFSHVCVSLARRVRVAVTAHRLGEGAEAGTRGTPSTATFLQRVLSIVLSAVVLVGPAGAGEAAQPPDGDVSSVAEANQHPRLPDQLVPDTFLLPDEQGRLQNVLGFSYEDFIEAYKLKHRIVPSQTPSRYSVQRFLATGAAKGTHAELRLEIIIAVSTNEAVRVPLGLTRALLRAPAQIDGQGDALVSFDASAGGYVAWLRAEPGQSCRVVLNVLVPLIRMGSEAALRISTPRATSSLLQLVVDVAEAVARVGDGSTIVARRPVPEGTELTVAGIGGDFQLAWRGSEGKTAEVPTVLEVSAAMLARVDGHNTNIDVGLLVRSFGGPFDRFRVRLPAGAELLALSNPGYTITPVAPVSKGAPPANPRPLVDVKLDEKTAGPVEVRLVTQQPHGQAGSERPFRLVGVEVLGAVRQFGHIAVQVVGDWHVQWTARQGVVRVDDVPEALRRDDLTAGFEYFRQPFSLTGRMIPRRTHVRVEPEVLMLVGPHEVRLEVKLNYTVRVKKAFAFRVDLAGWEIDRAAIGPANVFDVDASSVNEDGILSVPLLRPSKGQIELNIKAHRLIPDGAQTLDLPLPIPKDVSPTPATVIVLPDDNVELVPSPEEIVGLTPQRIAPPVDLPARQQAPLFYRGDAEQSRFSGQIRVHPRSIAVDVSSRIQLSRRGGRVEQTFAYQVAYEPVDSLVVDVPAWLADSMDLVVRLNGEALPGAVQRSHQDSAGNDSAASEALPDGDSSPPSGPNVRPVKTVAVAGPEPCVPLRIAFPKQVIGDCQLDVDFPFLWQGPVLEQSAPVVIHLPMPAVEVGTNEVFITASPSIQVAPRGDTWTAPREPTIDSPPRRELQLVAAGRRTELALSVQLAEPLPQNLTVVERLWIQTWLTNSARQDLAVYRLQTNASHLTFVLPHDVQPGDVMVLLNGNQTDVEKSGSGRVTVQLPETGTDQSQRLEFCSLVRRRAGALGRIPLEPMRLADDAWIQHVYWELVFPQDVHVVHSAGDFAREFVWDWHRLYWQRSPVLTTSQLETWSNASVAVRVPAAANRYLLSSVGDVGRLTVWTASRSSLVLAASGGTLVAGLLLIYVPGVRRAGVPLALATGGLLVVVAVRFPEQSLLVAQATGLGVAFTLLAAWLRYVARKRKSPSEVLAQGSGSSVIAPITTTEVYLPSTPDSDSSSGSTRRTTTPPTLP